MDGKSRSIIDVMKVADTGSFMTAVPRGVIPVLDTGIQFLLPGVKLSFLDSSVKHWNDSNPTSYSDSFHSCTNIV
ncbi:hypothetical protein [Wolbachia pipientis]|uniref:hypothetical protein n=1 Tax=Wolbachia pipientis TaxID=955 RepID=UPI001C70CAF7|nr:hypothetical protein [Wolbachia pipientis]